MEPASKIINLLGGAAAVASIAGVHRTRVYKWMRPREEGGTGGVIPQGHIPKIISAAREMGVNLSGDDFLPAGCVTGKVS